MKRDTKIPYWESMIKGSGYTPYTKDELLFYWGAVDAVTNNLKHPLSNAWAYEHCEKDEKGHPKFKAYHMGFDEVVVYELENEILICVNGSDKDKEEWKSNLKAFPIIDGCHNGFYTTAKTILQELINDWWRSDKPWILNGHSRGGAIVQDMAKIIQDKTGELVSVITFGSPRPFTEKESHKQLFPHHMVDTDGDIVCHIPTRFVIVPHRFPFLFRFRSYYTSRTRIRTGKILGLKKKHGEYGEMIRKYVKEDPSE